MFFLVILGVRISMGDHRPAGLTLPHPREENAFLDTENKGLARALTGCS